MAASGSKMSTLSGMRLARPECSLYSLPSLTDEGQTFENALTLSNNAPDLSVSGKPRVAGVGSDVYVVWEDDTGSTPGSPEIFFRRSNDGVEFRNPPLQQQAGGSVLPHPDSSKYCHRGGGPPCVRGLGRDYTTRGRNGWPYESGADPVPPFR